MEAVTEEGKESGGVGGGGGGGGEFLSGTRGHEATTNERTVNQKGQEGSPQERGKSRYRHPDRRCADVRYIENAIRA